MRRSAAAIFPLNSEPQSVEKKTTEPHKHEKIAYEAMRYARAHIKKSDTEHVLKSTYRGKAVKTILTGVLALRENATVVFAAKEYLNVIPDVHIRSFENYISQIKKYSLGNCSEQALLALDYIAQLNKQIIDPDEKIIAENYSILNGDHHFVVLGRAKGSLKDRPSTWGDVAYICDPWSQKVYPANLYLLELYNYKYIDQGTHVIERFNPHRHGMTLNENISSEKLDIRNDKDFQDKMRMVCLLKLHWMRHTLDLFHDDLVDAHRLMIQKYGNFDPRCKIVAEKIKKVAEFLQVPDRRINQEVTSYDVLKEYLEDRLKMYWSQLQKTVQFSPKKSALLFKKNPVKKLFHLNTDAGFLVKHAFKNLNKNLEKLADAEKLIDSLDPQHKISKKS